MTTPIKSTAARVLSTGEATEAEAKSLAAYALGDSAPIRTTRSREDLERMIAKLSEAEGQEERVAMMRAELAKMA
jgi:hypothetical protein